MKRTLMGIVGGGAVLAISAASADAFGFGTYNLGNHPDGGAAAPFYGLRLDGLLTGDSSDIYTFDFEHAESKMKLTYDATGVHIFGTAFGGLDAGNAYSAAESGVWEIDFKYETVLPDGNGAIVPDQFEGTKGSITLLDAVAGASAGFEAREGNPFVLMDVSGNHDYSFKIAEDHRGYEGYSGLGWLNHAPTDGGSGADIDEHMYSSDWLFAVEVPEPTTILGLTAIAIAGSSLRRRKQA